MLLVIRHARTRKDRDRPAEEWGLDPAGLDEMRAGASAWDWPAVRHWYSSPEPKAVATARLLTSTPVEVVDDLRELRRGAWSDEYDEVVRRLFARTAESPAPGWEPGHEAVQRFDSALRGLARRHPGEDVAVVTHGLVLSLWRARLAGADRVDLSDWRSLAFPDLLTLSGDAVAAWLADHPGPLELRRVRLGGSPPSGRP